MSFTVNIRVLGIPVEVRGNIDPPDPSVGLMGPALEDLEFYNVKNGSRLNWLEAKVEKLDKWNEVCEDVFAELESQARYDYPDPD